jgi:hypothetical protein
MVKMQLVFSFNQSSSRYTATWHAGNCKQKRMNYVLFLHADLKGKDSELSKMGLKIGFSTRTVAIGFVT